MKNPSPTPTTGGLSGAVHAVVRFFFEPSDTATLGLIRICAGFLVLYVHLMYSYDLYRLFGKDAWISHELVTDTRKNYPIIASQFEWESEGWFEVTDNALVQIQNAGVPQKTVDRLRPLMASDQVFHSRDEFLKQLRETLGADAPPFYVTQICRSCIRMPDLTANQAAYQQKWLSSSNMDPRQVWAKGYYVWSAWFHVTDPSWMIVIHVGFLLCMLLFALGLWTPVTGLVTWLAMLSYVNRSMTTIFGQDTIMNVLVLYLTLAHLFARPGTAALSLDRLLWRRRKAREGIIVPASGETMSSSATFAIRMMQIHFCLIYMGSGWSKLLGSAWWNGTAIWYTVANPEFANLHLRYYRDLVTWLCRHRVLWEISMTSGAMFTLMLEVGFPFLVWVPKLRWVMVIGAVMLHTGIAVVMGLTGFSLMMLALLVAFIPPATVRQLLGLAAVSPSLRPGQALAPA